MTTARAIDRLVHHSVILEMTGRASAVFRAVIFALTIFCRAVRRFVQWTSCSSVAYLLLCSQLPANERELGRKQVDSFAPSRPPHAMTGGFTRVKQDRCRAAVPRFERRDHLA